VSRACPRACPSSFLIRSVCRWLIKFCGVRCGMNRSRPALAYHFRIDVRVVAGLVLGGSVAIVRLRCCYSPPSSCSDPSSTSTPSHARAVPAVSVLSATQLRATRSTDTLQSGTMPGRGVLWARKMLRKTRLTKHQKPCSYCDLGDQRHRAVSWHQAGFHHGPDGCLVYLLCAAISL
jgi:hypothetical protein